MEFGYTYNDNTYTVSLQPQADGTFIATIGDVAYKVSATKLPSGDMVLTIEGQPVRAFYAANRQQTHFVAVQHRDVQHYTFTRPSTEARYARSAAGNGGHISAQMPGQVIELTVQPGDTVTQGQTLLILEAMKMEIRVQAPATATVAEVLVSAGETVERGQQLVRLSVSNIDK